MRALAVVAALSLAGCVGYAKTQGSEPQLVYASAKSQDAYLGCIAPRFMEIAVQSTTVRDGGSWVVALPGATATVSIHADGAGSRIEYRQMHELEWGSYGRAREAVSACL